ncbi:MAG: inositol monophosphatase [Actinobacteria bacterium]|nr:inositol monophosphatase [Actinomycetota bacterium]
MNDPAALVKLAEEVAREAGALLLERLRWDRDAVSTKTSLTDMVSEMDRTSEALILERLLAARPDDAIMAEEGGGRDGTSGVRWVIDPLDGTTNYLYGYPRWGVSIAAEVDGEVAAGVVADPSLGEVFTATAGGGAFRNGEPIAHSGKAEVATALVATGFSYVPERRARQAAVLTRILPSIRDIRRGGAASLDLCWVACGRVDGYYEATLQPWDIAAGALIAAEAGAVVSTFEGGRPQAPSVFAAAPDVAAELLELLVDAGVAESV